jgi:hypothetical protein
MTLVGAAAGPVGLHNVAPGSVASKSTDAVNGGQLNTGLSSVATTLGGGAIFDTATGQISKFSATVGGVASTTVGGALSALDAATQTQGAGIGSTLGNGTTFSADGTVTNPGFAVGATPLQRRGGTARPQFEHQQHQLKPDQILPRQIDIE